MVTRNQGSNSDRPGRIVVTVVTQTYRSVVSNAAVYLSSAQSPASKESESPVPTPPRVGYTDEEGNVTFDKVAVGKYTISHYLGEDLQGQSKSINVHGGCTEAVCFEIPLVHHIAIAFYDPEGGVRNYPRAGDSIEITIDDVPDYVTILPPAGLNQDADNALKFIGVLRTPGLYELVLKASINQSNRAGNVGGEGRPAMTSFRKSINTREGAITQIEGRVGATLSRTATEPTDDVALWVAIRNSTEALSFNNYLRFMDWLFCGKDLRNLKEFEQTRFQNGKISEYRRLRDRGSLPFPDTEAYRVVKAATEAFVMVNCGIIGDGTPPFDSAFDKAYLDRRDLPNQGLDLRDVFNKEYLESVDGEPTLPYLAIIRRKLPDVSIKKTLFEKANPDDNTLDDCFGLLQEKLTNPCLLELIWSYWHEEGMLIQTTNAISWRFQNRRSASPRDPLANLELDPLRPLNNLLWGYIQDEQHRLTVMRRNYEYDHHYGLRLEGQAVRQFNPADTRSKFLEAFHHLLRLCTVFYKQDDDTTVKADAFPVLNALKETHLVLSQGAHNQFGDLPSTARIEMLMQQWLLARPEFREVLPTRIMVAYPEPWMDRVDAMKRLQGWTDTSVLHFRNLAIFGEQILLAIRWGHWSDVQEPIQAFNWARFFRPQVQGYLHAYRAATGVDLTTETVDTKVDATLPSVLLKKRLALQQRAS